MPRPDYPVHCAAVVRPRHRYVAGTLELWKEIGDYEQRRMVTDDTR